MTLSYEQFLSLQEQPCHYCGSSLNPQATGSSLDRVDNDRGYEPDNVVTCCKTCNQGKMDQSVSDFRAWVLRVAAHMAGRHAS
jgi:hypothetical protein